MAKVRDSRRAPRLGAATAPGEASSGATGALRGASGRRAAGSGASGWLPLALVLSATIVLHLRALGTQFVADDYLFLDQVRNRSLWDALRTTDPLSNFFRPVSRQLYFWLVAGLTNESPLAFRIGNLATLLVAIALLFALVRHLVGGRAAIFASAFFALHYAGDVSIRWACGSQDLLAVAGALAAILLHVTGKRRAAGLAMLGAAFSKEVVLLVPAVAILADHEPREPWARTARRAWPLAAAVLVWFVVFLAMPHRRIAQGTEVRLAIVQGPLAAVAHLLQVAPGIEWLPGGFGAPPREPPPLLPLLAALVAITVVWRHPAEAWSGSPGRAPAEQERRAMLVAGAWIALATAPVAAVVLLWSSYYYLLTMAGVGLALGILLARTPAWTACGALALFSWGSANARMAGQSPLERNPWTPVSTINRSYIENSNRVTARYLSSLRRAYPRLQHGSTLFFAGLKSNVGFQRADGPLLRWAYRDSSLRSYYLNAFSLETARSGPVHFFVGEGDSLVEMKQDNDLYMRVAFSLIVSDRLQAAHDALHIAAERMPGDFRAAYWQSWIDWSLGDTAAAQAELAALGFPLGAGPSLAPGRQEALTRLAAGDTAGAIVRARETVQRHVLDAGAHGLLSDLLLVRLSDDADGAIEGLASRILAPGDPYTWRRWAVIQGSRGRYVEALASFQTYFRLAGDGAAKDAEARAWVDRVRQQFPRGAAEPQDEQ